MIELQVAAQACPFCATFYESMLEQSREDSIDLVCRFEGRTFKDGFVQLSIIVLSEKEHQHLSVVDDIIPSSEMISHWRIAYLDCVF
jgi:hypothetical protein